MGTAGEQLGQRFGPRPDIFNGCFGSGLDGPINIVNRPTLILRRKRRTRRKGA